jgi:hypothetical protein
MILFKKVRKLNELIFIKYNMKDGNIINEKYEHFQMEGFSYSNSI